MFLSPQVITMIGFSFKRTKISVTSSMLKISLILTLVNMIRQSQINIPVQDDQSVLNKEVQLKSILLNLNKMAKTYLVNSIKFRLVTSYVIFIWLQMTDHKDPWHPQEEMITVTTKTITNVFKKWLLTKDGANKSWCRL